MKKLIFISFSFYVLLILSSIGFAQDDAPQLVLPIGHTAPVTSVAFSPDGKYIVSGSEDTTIKLWETDTGSEVRTFIGYGYPVYSVAFSSDGRYLVSGCAAGRGSYLPTGENLRIWDVNTGKEIIRLTGQKGIYSVVFSSDGKYVLSGSYRIMNLWDINTGKEIMSFLGHKHIVTSVAFSPNGRYALSASYDRTLKLWDVSTGNEIRSFSTVGNKSPIWSASFSPDGKYVVASVSDKTLKLWSVSTGNEVKLFSGNTGAIYSVKFSPDGRYVIAGCSDNTAKLWEVSSGRQLCSLEHKGKVYAVAFSPDNKYILSGSEDKSMKLWDLSTGREIRTFKGYGEAISSNVFSPNGKFVASVFGDIWSSVGNKDFIIWDAITGRIIHTFSGHKDIIRSVAFSPDSRYIASGSQDKTIKLWDVSNGSEIRSFSGHLSGHKGIIYSIAFSPDGKYILSGSNDKTLKLWDVESGGNVKTFLHKGGGTAVAFSPNGLYFAAGALDDMGDAIEIWELKNGKKVKGFKEYNEKKIPSPPISLAFSNNGNYLIAGFWHGMAKVWDVNSGKEIAKVPHGGWVTAVALSPDSQYAISAGRGEFVLRFWEISTSKTLREFPCKLWNNSATFSPDGKYVLTGSSDGTTRLWETETGNTIFTRVYLGKDDWIVTTPDGRFDGSPDGIKLLHYAKDNKSIPLDSLFDRFYTPNLVAQVMSGKEIIPGTPDIRQGILMPPIVRITSPTEGQVLKEKDIEVVVESVDQGGGIEDVRLYHNDKRIIGDERGMKKSDKTQTKFTVSLINGINTIRATAFSKDRTESHPYEIKLKVDIAEATSDLYIVAIGINEYKNSNYTLNYCVPDAQAIIAVMSERGKGIFRNVNLRTVFDDQATKSGIKSALSHVEKDSRPEDVFVFYYSGHGVMSVGDENKPADFYLVPYDVTELYGNDAILDEKGFSATLLRDACQMIKATKQLLIIDSCQSGKMVETFAMKGASEEKAIAQLARSAGITVISATQTAQFALEFKEIKHGLFTYTLLQGMEGKADGSPKDNRITVSELSGYVQAQIPELSRKYRGKPQYPNVYVRGQDFPIVMKK